MFYVYIAINTINNKSYIGKTNNIIRRIQEHYISSENPYSVFHKALNKYGRKSFKWYILYETDDEHECFFQEMQYIKKFNTLKKGYNSHPGLYGGESQKYSIKDEKANILYTEYEVESIAYNQYYNYWSCLEKYGDICNNCFHENIEDDIIDIISNRNNHDK